MRTGVKTFKSSRVASVSVLHSLALGFVVVLLVSSFTLLFFANFLLLSQRREVFEISNLLLLSATNSLFAGLLVMFLYLLFKRMSGEKSQSYRHGFLFCIAALILYLVDFHLILFYLATSTSLDFSLYWTNRHEAFWVLSILEPSYLAYLLLPTTLLVVTTAGVWFLALNTNLSRLHKNDMVFVVLFVLLTVSAAYNDTEIARVASNSISNNSEVQSLYQNLYNKTIERRALGSVLVAKSHPAPSTARNIFLIQLESVNSKLATPTSMPMLFELAGKGVYFKNIQASAVATTRSQDSLLCGLPPSIGMSLVYTNQDLDRLNCLPKIMGEMEYRTLYFQSFDLNFGGVGTFMKKIGFDEVHSSSIMQDGDPYYKWGYDDRVFYKRVFEYLQKFPEDERLFIYIVGGSSNHYPFYSQAKVDYPEFLELVPFPEPTSFKEELQNTMYIQDSIVGNMLTSKYIPKYSASSDFYIFGDHSWPAGEKANNQINIQGAWQENFLTSMLFIPTTTDADNFPIGTASSRFFSTYDLYFAILSRAGLDGYGNKGHFADDSLTAPLEKPDKCIISVQPFASKQLVFIEFPLKYIFDTSRNRQLMFDLTEDPSESFPLMDSKINNDFFVDISSKCFQRFLKGADHP